MKIRKHHILQRDIHRPIRYAVLLCGLLCIQGFLSYADDASQGSKQERLVIKSTGAAQDKDAFIYDLKQEVIVQGGGMQARRGNVSLSCESLVAYLKEEEVYAEGNVLLTDGDLRITADKIYYSFKTHQGVMEHARVIQGLKKKGSTVEWVVYADKLVREDRSTFTAKSAWFTTCSFKEPHYRLKCSSVVIKPGKLLTGKHMVLCFGKVPVFYYPYFRHDLEHDWLPQDFDLGNSTVLGDYLKTKWKIYSNDVINLLLRIDITEERGTGLGGDLEYKDHKNMSGYFHYYAINDQKTDSIHRDRYVWKHYQKLDSADMVIKADVYSYSDRILAYDFFNSEYANQREYTPYIHCRQLFPEGELNLLYSGQIDDFQTVSFRSPALLMGIGPYSIGDRMYITFETFSARDGIDYSIQAEDSGYTDLERERIDSRLTCSFRTELGPLFCDAALSGVWAWYDEYLEPVDHRARTQMSHEIRLGTTVVGDFFRSGHSEDPSGVRHIFEPYISAYKGYEPTILNSAVEQLDMYDDLREDSYLQAGFTTSVDLFSKKKYRNIFHMDAFFRYYSDEDLALLNNEGEQWGDIGFEWSLVPVPRLGVYSSGVFDAGDMHFEELFTGIRWKYSTRLALHAEDYRAGDARNQILGMDVLANEKWSMGGYLRYDAEVEEYSEWRWFVTRVFHMWECTFTSVYDRRIDERTVGVKIRLLRDETNNISVRQGSMTAADGLDDYMFFNRY